VVEMLKNRQQVKVTIEGIVVDCGSPDLDYDALTLWVDGVGEVEISTSTTWRKLDIDVIQNFVDGLYYCQDENEDRIAGMSNVFKREVGRWFDRSLNPVLLTPDQEARMVRLVGEK